MLLTTPYDINEALELLKTNLYAVLSTITVDTLPWVSPVFFCYDQTFHLYWASARASLHSQNIANNESVSLVIFNSQVPWGTGHGLYLSGTAEEVSSTQEIVRICALREQKSSQKQFPENFSNPSPRRLYQFIPEEVWINIDHEEAGIVVDERKSIDLKTLQRKVAVSIIT